jgi:hypothetical protein
MHIQWLYLNHAPLLPHSLSTSELYVTRIALVLPSASEMRAGGNVREGEEPTVVARAGCGCVGAGRVQRQLHVRALLARAQGLTRFRPKPPRVARGRL